MGEEWGARLDRLDAACGGRDADGAETELARLADLNRVFSIRSTERYLDLLQVADPTLT